MKQLIEHLQKSIYGPEYYRELLGKPLAFSFRYYISLALLFSVFLTIASSLPIIPKLHAMLADLPAAVLAYYPDELEIVIERGIVSSNAPEPYYLPLPRPMEDIDLSSELKHFIVIDTGTAFSREQLLSHGALIWIGKDFVAYHENNNRVTTESLGKEMTFVLNEQTLVSILAMATPYFAFVTPLLVLIFFLGFVMMFAVNLAYLLIGALFIFVLGRLVKERWGYWKSYQIGMHAVTLPLLLNGVLVVLGYGLTQIPFLYTIVMLGAVYINFASATSGEQKPPTALPL